MPINTQALPSFLRKTARYEFSLLREKASLFNLPKRMRNDIKNCPRLWLIYIKQANYGKIMPPFSWEQRRFENGADNQSCLGIKPPWYHQSMGSGELQGWRTHLHQENDASSSMKAETPAPWILLDLIYISLQLAVHLLVLLLFSH